MKSDLIFTSLIVKMNEYFKGDPKRIQHFLKVYVLTETIARMENVSQDMLFVLKTAAVLHDIGIRLSEEKYGSAAGKYQEIEGVAPARQMMSELGYDRKTIERVCWLIAHHHTYDNITDTDHRILVEADFLVNMYEDNMKEPEIRSVFEKIFRTESGRRLCRDIFSICDAESPDRSEETDFSGSGFPASDIFAAANITPAYMVSDKCNGCGTCVDVCPVQCIDNRRTPVYIRQEECIHCGSCASVCIRNAIVNVGKKS